MSDIHQAKTVAVKACAACNRGLLEYDKFCRWCGARQSDSTTLCHQASGAMEMHKASSGSMSLATSVLEPEGEQTKLYRRVSGPLVEAVVAGVWADSSVQSRSLMLKRAILALISVPIWMIIVLLSPLDAYAAAKNLLRES